MLQIKKLWLFLIGIFLMYYVLETFIFPELLLTTSDFNFYFLRYFLFSSYFRFRTLLFVGYSILWTILEVLAIYTKLKQEEVDPVCLFSQTEKPLKMK